MTNRPRRFVEGGFYHIYHCGNHKDIVFRERADRVVFLSKLEEFCERDGMGIIAYCLMDNHFHLALKQEGRRSLSSTMRSLLQGYARYYNSRYGTVGSLFQGRFQSKRIDDPRYNPWHLARLSRYIHRNPAPFADFTKYRWSSYRQYTGTAVGTCDTDEVLTLLGSKSNYATFCVELASSEQAMDGQKYRVIAGRRLSNEGMTSS